jgi:hypothetical protein
VNAIEIRHRSASRAIGFLLRESSTAASRRSRCGIPTSSAGAPASVPGAARSAAAVVRYPARRGRAFSCATGVTNCLHKRPRSARHPARRPGAPALVGTEAHVKRPPSGRKRC